MVEVEVAEVSLAEAVVAVAEAVVAAVDAGRNSQAALNGAPMVTSHKNLSRIRSLANRSLEIEKSWRLK